MAKTITHQHLKSYFGEEDHLLVSQTKSFSQMIFELLSERKPTTPQLQIFEFILNISIDHGEDTPSALATIKSAQNGKTLSESLATAILQINDHHGGAVSPLMEILYQVSNFKLQTSNLVNEYISNQKKIPGLGHRIYKDKDPRTEVIFNLLKKANLGEEYIKITKNIKAEVKTQTGKDLPINIDGGIAVALCAFGWESKLGNAVFIIARIPGLCAHFLNNSL